MPLGFCIPEWIQNGIHFESGMSTVSSMLHFDSQTVLFSRGWGIDQPKFSQDKPRVVTVSTPEYDWFVFSSSSLLSCSFCCILELRNSIWILQILLTYTLHLVILHPRCVDVEWCWGPLRLEKFKSRLMNFPGRGTSPYGEPRESQGCFFLSGIGGGCVVQWLVSVVFKDIWYWGVMLFFCLYFFCCCCCCCGQGIKCPKCHINQGFLRFLYEWFLLEGCPGMFSWKSSKKAAFESRTISPRICQLPKGMLRHAFVEDTQNQLVYV